MKNVNFIIGKSQFLEDIVIDKVFVSNRTSSSEENYKHFVGFKIRLLCIILPKTERRIHIFMMTKYQKKILIVFVFLFLKKYYPQVFLEECEYVVKEKKVRRFINDILEISSDEKTLDREDSN